MGVVLLRMVIRDRSPDCPFTRTQSINVCISKGIGLAGIRSQAYDRTTNTWSRGYYGDDLDVSITDMEMTGGTDTSEEATTDDGDDSGSLTSVD